MVFVPWYNCPSCWVWVKSLGLTSNQYNTEKLMWCHFCNCVTEDCDFSLARRLLPYSPHLPADYNETTCHVGEAQLAKNWDYLPANSQWGTEMLSQIALEHMNPAKQHKWAWKHILPHTSLQIIPWTWPIYWLQLCKRPQDRKQRLTTSRH